jgi:hypothetical protein
MAYSMRLFVLLLTIDVSVLTPKFLDGQQHQVQNSASAQSLNSRLAKPVVWGALPVRLFKDDPTQITFTLSTSWIPGEDRKGRFRYKLGATVPQHGEGVTVDSIEKVLTRTQGCKLFLVLNDRYDFQLREIQLFLQRNVDDAMNLRALSANDSTSMDADEYRNFVGGGTADDSGNWNVTWDCTAA